MNHISKLWYSTIEADWKHALKNYWNFVQPKNVNLEQLMNSLKLERIALFNRYEWYQFLYDEYFRWKYTAPNRFATTTKSLKKYIELDRLDELFIIKEQILTLPPSDIKTGLLIAKQIYGLGIAGASGLLSLIYPNAFATVDQFVVKALFEIEDLPENKYVDRMKPESLSLKDGVVLINIMRRKAEANNLLFGNQDWTPRKIDMILWGSRQDTNRRLINFTKPYNERQSDLLEVKHQEGYLNHPILNDEFYTKSCPNDEMENDAVT